jgi:hypothetical protein
VLLLLLLLQPFFSLSGAELAALSPLVAGVSADTLKAVVPLLARQQPATVARMLTFLKGVSWMRICSAA